MSKKRDTLIIPVENQVRELEPKILLACIAARRGFECVIGSRLEIDFHIASFPRGIYLSKSMTARSVKMFRIMNLLGHTIAAWDEEALVHPPADTYFTRRLSAEALPLVSHLFAWGEENAALWRSYPSYTDTPIHVTGNPRGDMLRPELRNYYRDEAQQLSKEHGDFLLINTNFGMVNAFNDSQNLFVNQRSEGGDQVYGRGAVGMRREYALGLQAHKQALFREFQVLIPVLERAFPGINIVIRPHPVERPDVYHELASRLPRVKVLNNGNVIPWLMASKGLIHNGCTTGVEAYLLGVPAISYRPVVDPYFDNHVFALPNRLSHECFSVEEAEGLVQKILQGSLGAAEGDQREQLLAPFLSSWTGPLASQRIVDTLAKILEDSETQPAPSRVGRLLGWQQATKRRLIKKFKGNFPDSKYRPEFQRHRYPGLNHAEMLERVARFQELLGDPNPLKVVPLKDHIYRISA